MKILAADPGTFGWVDGDPTRPPEAVFRYRANGAHNACGVQTRNGFFPGYNPRGSDYCYTAGKAYTTFKYLVGGDAQVVDVNLEDYLQTPSDRTFSVQGMYRGVLATDSQFRVNRGRKLETCGDDEGTTYHADQHVAPGKTQAIEGKTRIAGKGHGKKHHRHHRHHKNKSKRKNKHKPAKRAH